MREEDFHRELNEIKTLLRLVAGAVGVVLQRQEEQMSQEQDDFQALVDEVTEVKGTEASAKALIVGLHDKVDALAAQLAAGNPITSEQILALRDGLKASSDDLAAAVAANPV